MKIFERITGQGRAQENAVSESPRTSDVIAQELSTAKERRATLAAQRVAAEQARDTAKREFNAAMEAYARGTGDAPGGEALKAASSNHELLEIAWKTQHGVITRLESELTAAKDAETAVADEEEARALMADAQAKFEKYAALARQFAAAERDALSACYSHKAGLKKLFRNAALNAIVRTARFAIRTMGIALAKELPGTVSTDWNSDEGLNLNDPRRREEMAIAQYWREGVRGGEYADAVREAREASEAAEASAPRAIVPLGAWS